MQKVFTTMAWVALAALCWGNSYREQMKGLDEQVQEIKSDVLSIDAELTRLEERLLYPSNTHGRCSSPPWRRLPMLIIPLLALPALCLLYLAFMSREYLKQAFS